MASSNASWSILTTPASYSAPETDVEQTGDSVPMAVDEQAKHSSDSDVEMQQEWVQSVRTEIEAMNKQHKKSRKQRRRAAEAGTAMNVNVEDLRQKLLDMQMSVKTVVKTAKRRVDLSGTSSMDEQPSPTSKGSTLVTQSQCEVTPDPSAPLSRTVWSLW